VALSYCLEAMSSYCCKRASGSPACLSSAFPNSLASSPSAWTVTAAAGSVGVAGAASVVAAGGGAVVVVVRRRRLAFEALKGRGAPVRFAVAGVDAVESTPMIAGPGLTRKALCATVGQCQKEGAPTPPHPKNGIQTYNCCGEGSAWSLARSG